MPHFSYASRDITVSHNGILSCYSRNEKGKYHFNHINLNKYIGNKDGHFIFTELKNFTKSAKNIRLSNNSILHADLKKKNGEWSSTQIDLNQYFSNDNGILRCDQQDYNHSHTKHLT